MKIEFTKMQGLGNDFAVIDATQTPFSLSSAQIQTMANRRFGIGFDQMLVIEKVDDERADFRFRIFNADGSEVEQCGNGARCAAHFVRQRGLTDSSHIRFLTLAGVLDLVIESDDKVTVQMGIPHFEPQSIPFEADDSANCYTVTLSDGNTVELSVVNVGNPHAVVFVDEMDSEKVVAIGEQLSHHPRFPEGVNVGFMQVIDPQNVRLRVYERGSGETLACGSGACAAMVAGRRNGLLQERVTVSQPGGSLLIDWQGPGLNVQMTGPAKTVFEGVWQG